MKAGRGEGGVAAHEEKNAERVALFVGGHDGVHRAREDGRVGGLRARRGRAAFYAETLGDGGGEVDDLDTDVGQLDGSKAVEMIDVRALWVNQVPWVSTTPRCLTPSPTRKKQHRDALA